MKLKQTRSSEVDFTSYSTYIIEKKSREGLARQELGLRKVKQGATKRAERCERSGLTNKAKPTLNELKQELKSAELVA